MRLTKGLVLAPFFILLTGCGLQLPFGLVSQTAGFLSKPESSYCTGTLAVSGSATAISATATFDRYEDTATGLTTKTNYPIRYAEIQILDGNGNQVQCGETDGSGNIGSTADMASGTHLTASLSIPRVAGTYTLVVNARANNAFAIASILNDPSDNQVYSITTTFTVTNEVALPVTITAASRTGTLEGGAFNILDQIVNVNNFLRANSTCGTCTTFTVAPKVIVYWLPGQSPGKYYNSPTTAVSFFNKSGTPQLPVALYILGGISGSVCTDTDHFDNSVIVHEYGHFLEYAFAKSDSPGGSHNGNSVIDPRLAWSEGWADFIQSQVLGRTFYRDTTSNVDCANGASLSFPDFTLNTPTAGQDITVNTGEGTFREFSTSRTLYTATSAGGGNLGFAYIWQTFSDANLGIKNSALHFRNPAGFFTLFKTNVINAGQTWNGTLNALFVNTTDGTGTEHQRVTPFDYGVTVQPRATNTCPASTFTFTNNVPVSGSNFAFKLLSNRYFPYYYDGAFNHSVVYLRYTGTNPYDLDLYVYNENYVLSDTSTMAGYSAYYYPEQGGGGSGYEAVDLWGKSAGYYLINVQATLTYGTDTTPFYLQTSRGEYLCP